MLVPGRATAYITRSIPMRDNFPARIVRVLAQRVGHQCSNPECTQATSGPAVDEDMGVNLGVAAHITAASIRGPRYEPALSPAGRRSAANGIWLCQNCAKLIDSDVMRFPADKLRKWKEEATERAFRDIATGSSRRRAQQVITLELDEEDREFLRSLALPAEDDVDSVVQRLLLAAERDLATYRDATGWPSHLLDLDLVMSAETNPQPITLEGLASAIGTSDGVNLVSDPGTGKTITLTQLGGCIAAGRRTAPVLVPLGEWSDWTEDFFAFLCRRNAFGAFRPQHFRQAAYHGRLILLLDGWNELDSGSRLRAVRALATLQREYPLMGVVVSTRRQPLPLGNSPVVEIQSLGIDQQLELARALRGQAGEQILDQVRRTPGVRELVAIPLYLTALILGTGGATLPQTREEVLRLFVAQHERTPEKREILARELFGCHSQFLIGLAVEANRVSNTVLSAMDARRVIAHVEDKLDAAGQLRPALQPETILNVLTSAHSIIRSTSGGGSIWFQHQQFQEWYASFHVEDLMRRSAQGDAESKRSLRVEVLDCPAWEESILFSCERMSREGPLGIRASASVILDALAIDPMLAAEMIYRSSPDTWDLVRGDVIALTHRWHEPGRLDRAFRFMLITARPEFAPEVWALIRDPDDRIHLRALRAAPQFRTSILGEDAAKHLAALPRGIRKRVIAAIAQRSGFEGIELATVLAKAESSPRVVVEILQVLEFRRADRHVADIMRMAPDEVWRIVAQERDPRELSDPILNSRLVDLRRQRRAEEGDPVRIVSTFAEETCNDPTVAARIEALLCSPNFPMKSDQAARALERAFSSYPGPIATALSRRVASGLELPFGVEQLLRPAPSVDDGPIAAIALNPDTPEHARSAAFALVGSKTVGVMMDQLFALDDEYQRRRRKFGDAEAKNYHRLEQAVVLSRTTSFFPALLERAVSTRPSHIRLMAALFSRRGSLEEGEAITLTAELRETLTNVVSRWIEVMVSSPTATRHQYSDVAGAVGRLGEPRLADGLKRMLDRDLADWDSAKDQHRTSPRRGPISSDVTHSYVQQYQRAFASIDGPETAALLYEYLPDPRFGAAAAGALLDNWKRRNASEETRRMTLWPDFSTANTRRKEREDARRPMPTSEAAERIFAVALDLGQSGNESTLQRHAIALAKIGICLPHGSERPELDQLLALPQTYATKQELLTSAALEGEILSSEMLLAGVRELLETTKTEPWRLDERPGELNRWLVLFPFCEHPVAVLEALELFPAQYREPWNLSALLRALAQAPDAGALEVLGALARRDPRIAQDYSWFNAIVTLGTERAGRALLRFVVESMLNAQETAHVGAWQLAQQLAQFGRKFPAIRDEVLRYYEQMSAGPPKSILEGALAELGDPQTILVMIRAYASEKRSMDGRLYNVIRDLAVGRRPAEGWAGAYEEFSVSLTALRKQLFELTQRGDAQSALAEAVLRAIEEVRDEHGRPDGEPRHPDIESGLPWPREMRATI